MHALQHGRERDMNVSIKFWQGGDSGSGGGGSSNSGGGVVVGAGCSV